VAVVIFSHFVFYTPVPFLLAIFEKEKEKDHTI
jgi:hypothetical protein